MESDVTWVPSLLYDSLQEELKQLRDEVKQHRRFLHALNINMVSCNNAGIQKLLDNAFQWSYAHRQGNGMLSEEEQQERIDAAFSRLCEIEEGNQS